ALENEVKQREEAEIALQRANRDKDILFSIISHDLRNPFQVLLGNTELMLEGLEDLSKADIEVMTRSVYRSARTAFNLLENLLTWPRLQQERIEYDPSPVNLHELAENTVALLEEAAFSKKIRLKHTIEEKLFAYADSY